MSRPLTLRLTEAAEADLAEIWAYVAGEASETMATRLVDKIRAACEPLCQFPLVGAGREVFGRGLRVSFAGRYALYYQPGEGELVIVRVLHGARDASALAAQGGFGEEGHE